MKKIIGIIALAIVMAVMAVPALADPDNQPKPVSLPLEALPRCYQPGGQLGIDPRCVDVIACNPQDTSCVNFCDPELTEAVVECTYDSTEPVSDWTNVLYSAIGYYQSRTAELGDQSARLSAKVHRKNQRIAHLRAENRKLRKRLDRALSRP